MCIDASPGGGAGGPAAAERGPSQRQGAVGEGEQDRRGAARGHGHIDHPHPGSAILSPLSKHPPSPRTLGITLIQGQCMFRPARTAHPPSAGTSGGNRFTRLSERRVEEQRRSEEPACSSS